MQDAGDTQQEIAQRIRGFMQNNLDKRLSLKGLARFLGYSEKYSSELFQAYMGMTFSEYIKRLRVAKASAMLTDKSCTIGSIAKVTRLPQPFFIQPLLQEDGRVLTHSLPQ